METFSPGDRVVAINTDFSRPLCGPPDFDRHPFFFPNGLIRNGVVYHVQSVRPGPKGGDGYQSIEITGHPVFWGLTLIYWNASRFRKVDPLRDHAPEKRRRKQPVSRKLCVIS